jgi:hypothetical protein
VFEERRRRRAVRRVKRGDGRPLKRFRWWQYLGRGLFYLRLSNGGGRATVYAVDVRHWGAQGGGEVKAHVYLDGRHHAESKIPAVFPVEGGAIEVAMSGVGFKRCHYVTADGAERQLTPDPKSAEGHRARLDRNHPALSRMIGFGSLVLLLIGAGLLVLQLLEPISEIPPIAESIGTFDSPIDLPVWLNIALGLATGVASLERATRLRYHWLLDGAAN